MLSFLLLIIPYIFLKNKPSTNPLYLNIFYFLVLIALFVMKLRGEAFVEISDLNFYSYFFLGFCIFIYFLVDTLKEIQLRPHKVIYHYNIVFISLFESLPLFLFTLLFYNSLKRDSLGINTNNDFYAGLLVLGIIFYEDFILSSILITISYVAALSCFVLYNRFENINYKAPLILLFLVSSLIGYDKIYILSFIYMVLFSVTTSDFIKSNVFQRLPLLLNIERYIVRFSNRNTNLNYSLYSSEPSKKNIQIELNRFSFVNFDTRRYVPLVLLIFWGVFFGLWSWAL